MEREGQSTEQNRTSEERLLFPDLLKILAAAAVVLMHTVTGFSTHAGLAAEDARQRLFVSLVDATAWCVPVFLMISGFFFLDPHRRVSGKSMLTKYVPRVLLALFLFGVPYALIEDIAVVRTFRLGMLPRALWNTATGNTWAHMWYLYLILVLYLCTPILRWVLEKIPAWCVIGAELLLLIGCGVVPWWMNRWMGGFPLPHIEKGIYLFFYLWGYLAARNRGRNTRLESERKEEKPLDHKDSGFTAGGMCLILMAVGILILRVVLRNRGVITVEMGYNDPVTVTASLLLFTGAATSTARGTNPILRLGSELSFGVYLVHPVFLNLFYKFFHLSLLDYPLALAIPGVALVTLAGSLLLARLLWAVKPLRKHVL